MKRNFFQRIFGKPATKPPESNDFWTFQGNVISVDLEQIPLLKEKGKGVRLERKDLAEKILLVHGEDDQFHALQNKCSHGGRCLDPDPGTESVQCCSVGKSSFGYEGHLISGSAKEDVKVYPVTRKNGTLTIEL